jgi:hypothetical protein
MRAAGCFEQRQEHWLEAVERRLRLPVFDDELVRSFARGDMEPATGRVPVAGGGEPLDDTIVLGQGVLGGVGDQQNRHGVLR